MKLFETDPEFRKKDREVWLSMPSSENGGGLPDKPASIFTKFYNVFGRTSSPSTLKVKEAEEKPDNEDEIEREWDMVLLSEGKIESEEMWEEQGDWVHVHERKL